MSAYGYGYCAMCNENAYRHALHGENGGPPCCVICLGKWHAEHAPRRKARRVVIKALKAYDSVGGSFYGKDFDNIKFAAGGLISSDTVLEDFRDLTSELLTATLALTHPDKHPPERRAEAQRVTQELLALKPFVFPAPKPEPPPKPSRTPSDASSKNHSDLFNKLSQYPCDDCRTTTHSFYCDACKGRWDEEQAKEREREEKLRVAKNARQRDRYRQVKAYRRAKPTNCLTCGKAFKPKRSDAQYCCAACRQRAYLKRDGKPSNAKPRGPQEIEQAIADVLTSNPDDAFTTDDLCARVYPGLNRLERKHRAAVVVAAKTVCERLGEWWSWLYSYRRGGSLVFFNHASVTAYAIARQKADYAWASKKSDAEMKAAIAPGGRDHEYVVEGGAWWQHCQEHLAKFKQATVKPNDAGGDLTSRHAGARS